MTFIDKATNEIHEYIQTKNNHEVQIHTCSQLSDLWLNLENRSSESFILFKVNPSMDIISLRNMISCSSSIPVYIINIEPVSSPYRMKSYEYSHLKYPLYASENVKKKEIFS